MSIIVFLSLEEKRGFWDLLCDVCKKENKKEEEDDETGKSLLKLVCRDCMRKFIETFCCLPCLGIYNGNGHRPPESELYSICLAICPTVKRISGGCK